MRHKPRKLTGRFLSPLKPAKPGDRDEYPDLLAPGKLVSVTARGTIGFALIARYPSNPKNPTRRWLAEYGVTTLADAREKARQWQLSIAVGRDPALVEEQRRQVELQKQATTVD